MSGFEIAGVVLAALPILHMALDFSRDGFSRAGFALHKRKKVHKLAGALLLQQGILQEIVKSVLCESGCDDVARLYQDPLVYLTDETVKEEVLVYLGTKNYAAFTVALKQSSKIVEKIAKNISGLVPLYKGAPDDLLAVINANRDAEGKQLDFLPRIKLAFGMKDIKKAAAELDNTTAALDTLARLVQSNRRVADERSSKTAVKLAKALRHVRTFANNLSLAILQGWGNECHIEHQARLFLEDRVDNAPDILKMAGKDTALPILAFQLIFAAGNGHEQILWHETVVQIFNEDLNNSLRPCLPTQHSGSSQVTFTTTQTTLPHVKPEITTIDDICLAIVKSNTNQQPIAFALVGHQQIGTICIKETTKIKSQQVQTIPLHALFSTTNTYRYSSIRSLKDRMLLALRLASNLLQLLQTRWLQSTWSKDMVYFDLRPGSDAQDLQVDLGRPFVSLTLDHSSTQQPASGNTNAMELKKALLELGILLLEIWHETTLESRFALPAAPQGYYRRFALAAEWQEDTKKPLPDLYYRAVSHCVLRPLGEARSLDWEDMKFWGTVCGEVIEPLSQNCRQWR